MKCSRSSASCGSATCGAGQRARHAPPSRYVPRRAACGAGLRKGAPSFEKVLRCAQHSWMRRGPAAQHPTSTSSMPFMSAITRALGSLTSPDLRAGEEWRARSGRRWVAGEERACGSGYVGCLTGAVGCAPLHQGRLCVVLQNLPLGLPLLPPLAACAPAALAGQGCWYAASSRALRVWLSLAQRHWQHTARISCPPGQRPLLTCGCPRGSCCPCGCATGRPTPTSPHCSPARGPGACSGSARSGTGSWARAAGPRAAGATRACRPRSGAARRSPGWSWRPAARGRGRAGAGRGGSDGEARRGPGGHSCRQHLPAGVGASLVLGQLGEKRCICGPAAAVRLRHSWFLSAAAPPAWQRCMAPAALAGSGSTSCCTGRPSPRSGRRQLMPGLAGAWHRLLGWCAHAQLPAGHACGVRALHSAHGFLQWPLLLRTTVLTGRGASSVRHSRWPARQLLPPSAASSGAGALPPIPALLAWRSARRLRGAMGAVGGRRPDFAAAGSRRLAPRYFVTSIRPSPGRLPPRCRFW